MNTHHRVQMYGKPTKNCIPKFFEQAQDLIKPANLVEGFCVHGFFPKNHEEVLKRLLEATNTSGVNKFLFNKSVVKVLKENCGVGVKKQRVQQKRGKDRARKTCYR